MKIFCLNVINIFSGMLNYFFLSLMLSVSLNCPTKAKTLSKLKLRLGKSYKGNPLSLSTLSLYSTLSTLLSS